MSLARQVFAKLGPSQPERSSAADQRLCVRLAGTEQRIAGNLLRPTISPPNQRASERSRNGIRLDNSHASAVRRNSLRMHSSAYSRYSFADMTRFPVWRVLLRNSAKWIWFLVKSTAGASRLECWSRPMPLRVRKEKSHLFFVRRPGIIQVRVFSSSSSHLSCATSSRLLTR